MNPISFALLLTEDITSIRAGTPAHKSMSIITLVKKGVIDSMERFTASLQLVDLNANQFLDEFDKLWTSKKIDWEELKPLYDLKIITDRTLGQRLGDDAVCMRIPSKDHGYVKLCKGYRE